MPVTPDHEAAKPNPALLPLGVLVGTWTTVGTHPLVPGTTFRGRAIVGRGEMSREGAAWEPDLQRAYTRAD